MASTSPALSDVLPAPTTTRRSIVKVPGTYRAKIWTTPVRCARCGEEMIHQEIAPDGTGERQGWPASVPCPGCGRYGTMREVRERL